MTITQLRELETIAAAKQRDGDMSLAEYVAALENIAVLRERALSKGRGKR